MAFPAGLPRLANEPWHKSKEDRNWVGYRRGQSCLESLALPILWPGLGSVQDLNASIKGQGEACGWQVG